MKKIGILFIGIILSSCTSEYRKLQMSRDADTKFEAAKQFFLEERYPKASTLLEEIVSSYRGTATAEQVIYLLSECYVKQQDYYSAREYYKTYMRNFPRGEYVKDVRYKLGYCYYIESPEARLDQEYTYAAINAFSEYIEYYPNAENVNEARKYKNEMLDKLSYKGYLNANLYYNLGLYGGNNFKSAVIVAEETLKEFPETSYREKLLFVILQSKYKEATYSVASKEKERYSEVIDEYYRYSNEFSEGKHIKEANKILKTSLKIINNK